MTELQTKIANTEFMINELQSNDTGLKSRRKTAIKDLRKLHSKYLYMQNIQNMRNDRDRWEQWYKEGTPEQGRDWPPEWVSWSWASFTFCLIMAFMGVVLILGAIL